MWRDTKPMKTCDILSAFTQCKGAGRAGQRGEGGGAGVGGGGGDVRGGCPVQQSPTWPLLRLLPTLQLLLFTALQPRSRTQ